MANSAARRFAQALRIAGADMAFGVPGGGPNLDVVEAMQAEGIRFVLAHGETAACIMASTYGHVSGKVAPTIVTRGPGAAAAVNGAAQATLDRQPLVLVTDTVPSATRDRVAHQRVNQRALFAPVTVGGLTFGENTHDADLASAISRATTWPRGAVHLDYDAAAGGSVLFDPSWPQSPPEHNSELLAAMAEVVAESNYPVILLGVGALDAADALSPLLSAFGAPVLSTYQATGIVGTEDVLCAGLFTNGASERELLLRADLIITVGLDIVEPIPTAWPYTVPVLSIAPTETTDNYMPRAFEAVGDVAALSAELLQGSHRWPAEAGAHHRDSCRHLLHPTPMELGPVDLVQAVAGCAPAKLTTTVDAGAHFLAVMPFWPVAEPNRLLISNGLATMGYSVPAAIGAALARPGEPVLSFVGDGGLGMVLAELETIVRLNLPITVVAFNDASLSLIEIKQKTNDGNRDAVGYNLTNFADVAKAMGMDSAIAKTTDQVAAALGTNWNRPRLIDARVDPTPYRHLISVTRGS